MAELNRQKRQVLRHIQDHFNTSQKRRGALFEQASTVDIYHHPRDVAAFSNYVTPRRGVAWVPGTDVKRGLDRLDALERIPRLRLIKGLFPQAFHMTMKTMNLEVETDYPILTYGIIPDCDQEPIITEPVPAASHKLACYGVADQNAVGIWLRLGLEGRYPDVVEVRKLWENVVFGHEMYFLVSDDFTIAGGASVILDPPVAQIVCADTIVPYRRRGIASTAIRMAVQYAEARDCSLIFIVATTEPAMRLYHRLGFVDLDYVTTYSRPDASADLRQSKAESQNSHARSMAQPIPARR